MSSGAARVLALATLLVGAAVGAPLGAPGSPSDGGTFGSESVGERPVTKVVNLLKDMGAQLEKEQKEDEEVFDQFACWCETNDKVKTKAIADAETKIKDLSATIEELTAKGGQLTTEIAALSDAIDKGEKALDEATAVRDKELADFNQQDKDAVVAIKGLHSAVETLKKHNAAALSQEAMLQLRQVISRHFGQEQLRALGLAPKQQRFAASFLQQPVAASSYSSASGEIFGVLSSMKESFETNMVNSRAEEEQAAKEFASLKAAKTKELAAANEQKDSKTSQLAKAGEDNENAKTDRKDTTAQLEADTDFLADLKSRCAAMDKEWEARQQMRQDETTAISEALKILTDDDARELMSSTTGFVQTAMRSQARSAGREAAARLLSSAADRLSRPKLALLAASMGNDVFAKVVTEIDGMVAALKEEGKEEIKHRDYCIEELHQNDLATDEKYHEKSNLETKQADLAAELERLKTELAAASAAVTSTQIEMKKASETRAQESKDFTVIIADQRATQEILKKAVAKLNAFYERKAALLQTSAQRAGQAPPPSFEPYKKAGGGGVVAMIEGIIAEAHHVEKHAISDNSDSQLAYEEFMKDSNKAISMLRKQIEDQTQEKAVADADMARTKADLSQNLKDLEALDSLKQEIHIDCDFVLKEFERRQDARTEEIDALNEAKFMLSK